MPLRSNFSLRHTPATCLSGAATCLSATHQQLVSSGRQLVSPQHTNDPAMRVISMTFPDRMLACVVLADRRALTGPAAARCLSDYGIIWCDFAHFMLTFSSALASVCSFSAHFLLTFGLISRGHMADQATQRSPATTIRHIWASTCTFWRLTARTKGHDPYLLRGR